MIFFLNILSRFKHCLWKFKMNRQEWESMILMGVLKSYDL